MFKSCLTGLGKGFDFGLLGLKWILGLENWIVDQVWFVGLLGSGCLSVLLDQIKDALDLDLH